MDFWGIVMAAADQGGGTAAAPPITQLWPHPAMDSLDGLTVTVGEPELLDDKIYFPGAGAAEATSPRTLTAAMNIRVQLAIVFTSSGHPITVTVGGTPFVMGSGFAIDQTLPLGVIADQLLKLSCTDETQYDTLTITILE